MQEPIETDSEVQDLVDGQRFVRTAVGPERQAQQRDECRRAIPAADAMQQQPAVVRQRHHDSQILSRQANQIPRSDLERHRQCNRRDFDELCIAAVRLVRCPFGKQRLWVRRRRILDKVLAADIRQRGDSKRSIPILFVDFLGRCNAYAKFFLSIFDLVSAQPSLSTIKQQQLNPYHQIYYIFHAKQV